MILLVSLLRETKTRKQISNSTRPTFEQFRLWTIHHAHTALSLTLSPGAGGLCWRCRCRNTNLCCASEQHLHMETRGWLTITFLRLFETTVSQLGEATLEWTWGKDSPLTGLERANSSKNQTGVCWTRVHTLPNTPLAHAATAHTKEKTQPDVCFCPPQISTLQITFRGKKKRAAGKMV